MREGEARSRPFARQLRQRLTNAETILWSRLKSGRLNGWRFRRQHPIGPYVADFACVPARLTIEVDGETHWRAAEIAHDRRRSAFIRARGFHELRVWNNDVYDNLDGVLDAITAALPPSVPEQAPGHLPRKRGRKTDAALKNSNGRHPS
ncbi:endonuclease domain-containing protein [Alkalicaulis satelles]|uniref:Endonuclease domain-containing protein n=1 Tax=Alkalicaulis satelles TaxID=2609175 RepID=A0A5M6ZN53_9PROT|nr:DUF559 domain-containing protein [Alkalicaulis satelles]KAA5805014.1 endonuclease domain-containing protein [Alkalicaulis satelles]